MRSPSADPQQEGDGRHGDDREGRRDSTPAAGEVPFRGPGREQPEQCVTRDQQRSQEAAHQDRTTARHFQQGDELALRRHLTFTEVP
jgi:hypothetical protein